VKRSRSSLVLARRPSRSSLTRGSALAASELGDRFCRK
jgi:hypothetical protein